MANGKFYVRIVGIVFDPSQKKVLIGKRKTEDFWTFIDGELEGEKELNQSLKQLTKDKIGFEVSNLGTVFANNKKTEEGEDELSIYFLCEVKSGEESLAEHIEEIKWVKADEIEALTKRTLPSRLREYLESITG